MQKTDFPIEILIHDDCSTDGTTEIIREYEAKYPDLIFPLYEEENQYQQGKAAEIDFYNYRRARGKYIAYCEGDDYWTDPLKLQKQVDFMEANPEYSVCFHDFQVYDVRNAKWSKPLYNQGNSLQVDGEDI
jgi:glycosyltransferase involved in cell wall biosynthesis